MKSFGEQIIDRLSEFTETIEQDPSALDKLMLRQVVLDEPAAKPCPSEGSASFDRLDA
jgi:hypothetical protein